MKWLISREMNLGCHIVVAMLIGAGIITCLASDLSAADTVVPMPVVIELFTSEGCSSCPPADAWLQKLDSSQPIAGAQLIVLSEHVDYWNRQGWKDPYSSVGMTQRQVEYGRKLGLKEAYTPQVIVDGTTNLESTDEQQVDTVLQRAATAPKVPIRITNVSIDPKSPITLRAHIEVGPDTSNASSDVYAVVALSHAESEVLRGENSGKHLAHVAVVQELTKVGRLEKSKELLRDVQLTLKAGTDPNNLRFVVLVQQSGPGKVIGAAMKQDIH